MSERNCINCGAPINEHVDKCPYCGTLYYGFCGMDIDGQTPIAFRVKLNDTTTVNFIAKPIVASFELQRDEVQLTGHDGQQLCSPITRSTSLIPQIEFHVIPNKEGNLCTVKVKE